MIYRKPSGVSYVDMCIYIDDNVYSDTYDENTVFEYLYHISLMLAKKSKYFSNNQDYDNFSVFSATRLFLRLIYKRELKPIVSILNYAKKVLPLYKVDYQNSEYSNVTVNPKHVDEKNYTFNNILSTQMLDFHLCDFALALDNIPKTCENFLSTIPYPKESSTWMNIYLSVIMTLLDMITLSDFERDKLRRFEDTGYLQDYHLPEMYDRRSWRAPVLYHLPSSMSNYILVLTRQVKHLIAQELSDILGTRIHPDFVLDQFLSDLLHEGIEDEFKD